jgi:hypothetical protein
LTPTTPHSAAGWRIEPPVSVPIDAAHSDAATPPPSRPTIRPARARATRDSHRLNALFSFDEPIANSSMLSLPSITAPAPARRAVTVDS